MVITTQLVGRNITALERAMRNSASFVNEIKINSFYPANGDIKKGVHALSLEAVTLTYDC